MFRRVVMVNHVKIENQTINIFCHAYKKIKLGDSLIQVYQGKLYCYTIKRIWGYREQIFFEAEEGNNYGIEIELQEKSDKNIIKKLLYGDYLFVRDAIPSKEVLLFNPANFELANDCNKEQVYKYSFFYKNYDNGEDEVRKIADAINALEMNGYKFCYDRKGNYISNILSYIAEEKSGSKSIHLDSTEKGFYLHGVIGYKNQCMLNRIEIVLPEKCIFYDKEVNNDLFILFKELNHILSPFWSYIGNLRNVSRFPYDGGNLPTSIHHVNYYCKELVQEIKCLFDIELPEYLVIRRYPFNDYLQSDLELQKCYYQTYRFDNMLKCLQKLSYESEEELLLYYNMLYC